LRFVCSGFSTFPAFQIFCFSTFRIFDFLIFDFPSFGVLGFSIGFGFSGAPFILSFFLFCLTLNRFHFSMCVTIFVFGGTKTS